MDLLLSSIMNFQSTNEIDIPALLGPRFNRVNVFYSTPEYYTQQKFAEMERQKKTPEPIQWQTKQDDFFPYSDCENCFWSGYFTSRANFKRLERVASAILMAVRQIDAYPLVDNTTLDDCPCRDSYEELEDAMGVVQHHDAVSGTAMQHVADDYSKRVQAGINQASRMAVRKLRKILLQNASLQSEDLSDLRYCQLLNETKCPVSEEATKDMDRDVYVVVYNPQSSERSTIVRLPVAVNNATYTVQKVATPSMPSQIVKSQVPTLDCHCDKHVLYFDTGLLPAVGASVYKVSRTSNFSTKSLTQEREVQDEVLGTTMKQRLLVDDDSASNNNDQDDVVYTNTILTVTFDKSTGALKHTSTNGVEVNISQSWGYYTSFDSTFDKSEVPAPRATQNSGAYVFRPSVPDQALQIIRPSKGKAQFAYTNVGLEVHMSYEVPWIRQVTRILQGQPYIEVEYEVGPIPIDDGRGKEIVTRISTPLQNNAIFYTDSNGRQFMKRQRNFRPTWNVDVYEPIAGNYYPVNTAMYLEDSQAALCIAVDRSQGGGSILDGSLELMVHRRTLADDARGVGEPLNETSGGITPYPNPIRVGPGIVVRGTHRILVGKGHSGASLARSMMDSVFTAPLIFVGSASKQLAPTFKQPSYSGLLKALPPNVLLITYKRLKNRETPTFLIRLGHQYADGEDKLLSSKVRLCLKSLVRGWHIESIEEKTLVGNEKKSDSMSRKLNWSNRNNESSPVSLLDGKLILNPMEIRTFEIGVSLTK
jgi:alpha-mannosidase